MSRVQLFTEAAIQPHHAKKSRLSSPR